MRHLHGIALHVSYYTDQLIEIQTSGGSTYKSFRRAPSPQQDQILSFLHMFSPKSTCVRGWHPLQRGLAPPPPMGNPGSAPVRPLSIQSQSKLKL